MLPVQGALGDRGQVQLGPAQVRESPQLHDDAVDHPLHNVQRPYVVLAHGKDLFQPAQVLLQAALHAADRASHLCGEGAWSVWRNLSPRKETAFSGCRIETDYQKEQVS